MDFDNECSLFAVYDGHGGHEVAEYTAEHLPDFIKQTDAYKKGAFEEALKDAFLGFDALLATDPVIEKLKEIAFSKKKDDQGKIIGFKSINRKGSSRNLKDSFCNF